ncbi:MBL fold metallo-hydrolase [Candidatus Riflebacteria bacterium]
MRVKFWGTHGSIPSPLRQEAIRTKLRAVLFKANGVDLSSDEAIDNFIDRELEFHELGTFGGDTSCVQLDPGGDTFFLCDAGSGLRVFGNSIFAKYGPAKPKTYHFFMSHLHWDHIMGFPFFVPAYLPGNKIVIHSCHAEVEKAFRIQNSAPCFPVPFESLGADISFKVHSPDTPFEVEDFKVKTIPQSHGGGSYGYRFENSGKTIVYSTDSEHKKDSLKADYPFIEFFHNADLLIFDAQYSLVEAILLKQDWGHSSNLIGVELAQRAHVKKLCMFHHEPNLDDQRLAKILKDTVRYEKLVCEGDDDQHVEVITAYDGLQIDL